MNVGQRARGENQRHVPKDEARDGVGPDGDGERDEGKCFVDDQGAQHKAAAGAEVDIGEGIGTKRRRCRDIWVWVSETCVCDVGVERQGVAVLGIAEVDPGAVGRRVRENNVIRRIAHAGTSHAQKAAVIAAGGVSGVQPGLQHAVDAPLDAHCALQIGTGFCKGIGRVFLVEVGKGLLQQDAAGDGRADGLAQLQLRGNLRGLERCRQCQAVGLDADDEVVDKDPCRDGDDGERKQDGEKDKRGELLPDGDSHFRRANAMENDDGDAAGWQSRQDILRGNGCSYGFLPRNMLLE